MSCKRIARQRHCTTPEQTPEQTPDEMIMYCMSMETYLLDWASIIKGILRVHSTP